MNTPALSVTSSRRFPEWLHEHNISLAISTYQSGKLLMVGLKENGQLAVHPRNFDRPMGLAANGPDSFYLVTESQLIKMQDVHSFGKVTPYDRNYIPQISWTTGDIDGHEVAIDKDHTPIIVNTRFSCLVKPSINQSFTPIWKPPFISRLAAEDRCHLNGVAMKEGSPA